MCRVVRLWKEKAIDKHGTGKIDLEIIIEPFSRIGKAMADSHFNYQYLRESGCETDS